VSAAAVVIARPPCRRCLLAACLPMFARGRDTQRAMSRENVELVRKLYRVYNERSFAEHPDLVDPDVVWDMSRVALPDATSLTGRAELPEFIDTFERSFAYESMEPREILDAGDRVVVVVHQRGRGKLSGIEVEQTFAMVWTLRDGRAIRMDIYPTLQEALEAVGLSE
jgi:ketosteroid isomerase-like protein